MRASSPAIQRGLASDQNEEHSLALIPLPETELIPLRGKGMRPKEFLFRCQINDLATTTGVRGVPKHPRKLDSFTTRFGNEEVYDPSSPAIWPAVAEDAVPIVGH